MRSLLQDTMKEEGAAEEVVAGPSKGKGKGKVPAGRDDDTHYFDSYAENGAYAEHQPDRMLRPDIHEIMLKDTTVGALSSDCGMQLMSEDHLVCQVHSVQPPGLPGRYGHGCWMRYGHPVE